MPPSRASIMRTPCPGCGALFAAHPGPTHRYIGASSGCWALYSELLIGVPPSVDVLTGSEAPPRKPPTTPPPPRADLLLVDAYAAQHHGVPSPQAVQSVAVHLLALHGTLTGAVDPSRALWIRERALRRRGVFHWLIPPHPARALTIRHLFPGAGPGRVCSPQEYVASVFEEWRAVHGAQLEAWYRAYVEADRIHGPGTRWGR